MSHGTRKAIAGGMAGERSAHAGCMEAIKRFDACNTYADIDAVLAWVRRRGGWFLRSAKDEKLMHLAYEAAKVRALEGQDGGTEEERMSEPKLSDFDCWTCGGKLCPHGSCLSCGDCHQCATRPTPDAPTPSTRSPKEGEPLPQDWYNGAIVEHQAYCTDCTFTEKCSRYKHLKARMYGAAPHGQPAEAQDAQSFYQNSLALAETAGYQRGLREGAAAMAEKAGQFRLRAATILCETRGHTGYRPCDFCLNVTLFDPDIAVQPPEDRIGHEPQPPPPQDKALRELVAKWREDPENWTPDRPGHSLAMQKCAQELESLLPRESGGKP